VELSYTSRWFVPGALVSALACVVAVAVLGARLSAVGRQLSAIG
jgi:hypothetical protein